MSVDLSEVTTLPFDPVEFIDQVRAVLGLEPIPQSICARTIDQRQLDRQPGLSVLRAQLRVSQAERAVYDHQPRGRS